MKFKHDMVKKVCAIVGDVLFFFQGGKQMSEVFAQLMPDRFSEIGKDIGHRSIARCQINRQTIGNIVKRYRLGLYKMVLQ